jgi:hypothetical protein
MRASSSARSVIVRRLTSSLALSAALTLGACGSHANSADNSTTLPASQRPAPTSQAAPPMTPSPNGTSAAPAHHSKLGGALVGAAVGHVMGGHAMAGAAAGAMVQHERNKRP